jgi:methyl coenzyme M reductase subunit D
MLGTRNIMEMKDDDQFSYEIEATPEQASELQDVLEQMNEEDFELFLDGHALLINETLKDTAEYNDALREVHRRIYELGTSRTKEQLSQLGHFPPQ